MFVFLPILLLGGVLGLAWQQPLAGHAKLPEPVTAASGLGGYLQGVVGTLNDDPNTAQTGLLGALSEDPENLGLRQRAMEASLAAGNTANALRLAKTLESQELSAMARLLLLAEAVRLNDLKTARSQLRALRAATPSLPLLEVLDSYFAAVEGTATVKLIPAMRVAGHGWSGAWHGARLWLNAGNHAAAVALLQPAVVKHPGAYLAAAQLLPLLPAAEVSATQAAFAAANPALAPLMQNLPTTPEITKHRHTNLANNTAAALLEFALQIWAEGVPGLALQVLNTTALLPLTDPLLQPLLPYYTAVLTDGASQTDRATQLYHTLVNRPDGFGQLAQMRLNELAAQAATSPRARQAAATKAWAQAVKNQQPVFWHSAVQLALVAGQYPKAAEAATTLLSLLPASPSSTLPQRQAALYFARGAAWAQAKATKKAEADLQQAIALNPAHAEALNYLGFLWVEENRNLAEAFTLLKRAHLLAPNNGAITDSVGWAYYRNADYATALQYLELAAQQEPGSPEILSHLADTYAKLGKPEEAQKLWRRALDLATLGAEVPDPNFLPTLHQKLHQKLR